MASSTQFWRHAEEARAWARKSTDAKARAQFEEIALRWMELASIMAGSPAPPDAGPPQADRLP